MMLTYHKSDELTSIAQYFFSEAPQKLFFAEVFQHRDKWKNNLGMFHCQREAKASSSTTPPGCKLGRKLTREESSLFVPTNLFGTILNESFSISFAGSVSVKHSVTSDQ